MENIISIKTSFITVNQRRFKVTEIIKEIIAIPEHTIDLTGSDDDLTGATPPRNESESSYTGMTPPHSYGENNQA